MKSKIKIICFDIDNVICQTKGNNYKFSKPDKTSIKIINKLYNQGFYIKIFTARYMGRFKESKRQVLKKKLETKKALRLWGVNYHKLIMCKPTYDLFIDDKTYGFSSNWKKNIFKIIKK